MDILIKLTAIFIIINISGIGGMFLKLYLKSASSPICWLIGWATGMIVMYIILK